MAAAAIKLIMPEIVSEKAEKLGSAYNAISTAAAKGESDPLKVGTTAVKSLVSDNVRDGKMKLLTTFGTADAEIIKNALNQDKKEVLKSARDRSIELWITILELEELNKKHRGEKIAAGIKILKSIHEYHEKLNEAFEDALDFDEENEERYQSLKKTMINQAERITAQIDGYQDFLDSCKTVAPVPVNDANSVILAGAPRTESKT